MAKTKTHLTPIPAEPLLIVLIWQHLIRLFGRRRLFYWFIVPALLYFVVFFLTQPHYITNFTHGFYLDNGDGLQNVWNVWWVDKALVTLRTNPYFTTMLHWPHGVTLIPQTMNIYNCLVAIPLMRWLGFSLVEAINFAVVSAFVLGGVTMFWFIYKLHKQYWVALVGGALFTFSSFHFAHAQGHLQLVSLQFIPLFFLAYWTLLEKVRYRYAVAAAGALFLVMLCDYYYLMWSVIVGGLWLAWKLYKKELKLTRHTLLVLGVFFAVALALVGPLMYKLVHLNKVDTLTGSHDPMMFSLDPLMIFVPGGSWYWHSLTDRLTTVRWPFFAESSMFFGFGSLSVLAYGAYRMVLKRKANGMPSWLYFWWIIMLGFAVMALGPHLTIAGHRLMIVQLPYALAERMFPTLQVSGMPLRWVLVSLIAAIVIVTYWLGRLDLKQRSGKIVLAIFLSVTVLDLFPRQLPLTLPVFQPYVYALKKLPPGAVIDNGALTSAEQLYNQTLHEKPQAFGYVTRAPRSVEDKDFHIFAALEQGRYNDLCRVYKVRYLTTPIFRPLPEVAGFPVLYSDKATLIYDLKNGPQC